MQSPKQLLPIVSVFVALLAACEGPAGPSGPQGASGSVGSAGPAGPEGPAGAAGPQGASGEPGTDGSPGTPGADGAPGAPGTPGAQGAPGADGVVVAGVFLEPIGRYESGIYLGSAAEIVAFDPDSDRVFVVNANDASVDVLSLADPTSPVRVDTIDAASSVEGRALGAANSVAVADGLLAVAIEADDKQDNGVVAFYDTTSLERLAAVDVGALPDMLIFTHDGTRVLVANEGEPNDDYTVDPVGSISIIDLSDGAADASVTTLGFDAFDAQIDALREAGVRVFGPGATVSQDLEPEYVAVAGDDRTAWVSLQEANAIAVVDLVEETITAVLPLGVKDHDIPGNDLDASDRDGDVAVRPWPVFGMFQPDAIDAYEVGGRTFLVTANEGDARDYDGYSEEERIGDMDLDPERYPDAAALQTSASLGRLRTTSATGDTDGDGDIDAIHTYGARSFSVWDASTGRLVWDSGNDFEVITANLLGHDFNNSNEENAGDSRSDNKGPEPEALTLARIGDATFAFIGLERTGGIMVYDVTSPYAPRFVQYANHRDFTVEFDEDGGDPDPTPEQLSAAGDLGPESVIFIDAAESPSGEHLLVVGNEVSGTTTIYRVVPITR